MDTRTRRLADKLIASLIAESAVIAATPFWKPFALGALVFGAAIMLAVHVG